MPHEFALYSPEITQAFCGQELGSTVIFFDEQVWHRLKHVLRAAPGFVLCLFDRQTSVHVAITNLGAGNEIQCILNYVLDQSVLIPKITVLLPLLKREAFADAVYSCSELGVQHIQLVRTHKSQQGWSAHDRQRCEKIIIAAAEQSKNFMLPILSDPLHLSEIATHIPSSAIRIHCDPQGQPLLDIINKVQAEQPEAIVVSIGPEGDMLDEERKLLYQQKFIPCALTPTVLRAQQAVTVALGALRACLLKSGS